MTSVIQGRQQVSSGKEKPQLSGLPLYAVVDPYFGEPPALDIEIQQAQSFEALAALRKTGWQGHEVTVASGSNPVINPRQLPYLVALDGANDPLLAKLLEAAASEYTEAIENDKGVLRIGALIETAIEPDRLMVRLQRMWCVKLGSQHRYLRIADPRVFEMLQVLFDEKELQYWLGPIACWHFQGRGSLWQKFDGAASESLIEREEGFYRRAQKKTNIWRAAILFCI